MSALTFTWPPDLGAARSIKPSVKPMKFGDGYESRIPIGINLDPNVWTVRFTRAYAEAAAINAFLLNANATSNFAWTDPQNNTANYVCRSWTFLQKEFGVYEISAKFEQVFEV